MGMLRSEVPRTRGMWGDVRIQFIGCFGFFVTRGRRVSSAAARSWLEVVGGAQGMGGWGVGVVHSFRA